MSTFSKILDEKLKKQDLLDEESFDKSFYKGTEDTISVDLLKWLNSSPLSKKVHYKLEDSAYSGYKKDPKILEKERLAREKTSLYEFLTLIVSEKDKQAVMFFHMQGARSFMSMKVSDLKKDYKKLALKLHPDRHFNEIPSVKKSLEEDFSCLNESYQRLQLLYSRAK